ncbi:MAG: tetratricopeptide repeat protein [Spirochaetaceae bacterium]|nr:tetratricopeptide repeat protein [Spirochaetaceae bacterium]
MIKPKLIILLLFVSLLQPAIAQSSRHFQFITNEVPALAEEVLFIMELNLPLYIDFLYPATPPNVMLNLSLFANNNRFNEALRPQGFIGVRHDFIYLDFNNPERNVLFLYPLTVNDNRNMPSELLSRITIAQRLSRHGFLQYSLTAMPKLPAWLREGAALLFEGTSHRTGEAVLEYRRTDFLATLQQIHAENPLSLNQLLALTDGMNGSFVADMERNLAYSWGFVHYLMVSGQQQILRQVTAAIDDALTYEQNRANVAALITAHNLEAGFFNYITGTPDFTSLMAAGQQAHNEGNFTLAQSLFTQASVARSDLFSPFYYLGLVAYEQNNFELAESYYQEALERGAPEALITFSRALIAFKEGRYPDSAFLLEETRRLDAITFASRVDNILRLIPHVEQLQIN